MKHANFTQFSTIITGVVRRWLVCTVLILMGCPYALIALLSNTTN